jgi:hypothetical protein
VYIDLETGTIVNGPIVFIPLDVEFDMEGMSDSEIIDLASAIGTPVTVSMMEE